ncbi:MAG: hypothetical protein JHC93_03155 [Parachlamydiales bacterium]|nr:hypothetical protein [Parachlamydiales bacterium]
MTSPILNSYVLNRYINQCGLVERNMLNPKRYQNEIQIVKKAISSWESPVTFDSLLKSIVYRVEQFFKWFINRSDWQNAVNVVGLSKARKINYNFETYSKMTNESWDNLKDSFYEAAPGEIFQSFKEVYKSIKQFEDILKTSKQLADQEMRIILKTYLDPIKPQNSTILNSI